MRLDIHLHFPSSFTVKVETVTPAAVTGINQKLDTIIMKLSEAETIIVEGAKKLGEAQTEILAKIAELEAADPDISPEGTAALESIRSIATALADIVPNPPPPVE